MWLYGRNIFRPDIADDFGAKNVLPLQPQSLTARDKKATSFLVAKSHRKKQ